MSSSRALSSRSVDVRQCVAAHDPSEGRLHLRGGFSRKTFNCIGLVCVQCCSAGRCRLTGGLCSTTAQACSMLLLIGGRVPVPIVMPHQQNDAASEKHAYPHCHLSVTASELANVRCRTLSDARDLFNCLCAISTSCKCASYVNILAALQGLAYVNTCIYIYMCMCTLMCIYIYVYVYPYVYIYAYMCMCINMWWGMLVMNILVLCCGCDTGAEGVLALQNGMSWTSLLNNSGCINAKYVARRVHRCVSAEANEWYCQANSVAVGF